MAVEVKTLRPGDGVTFPKPGDKLYTHYVGRLSSGQEIDSSYERRLPFRPRISVPLNQLTYRILGLET